MSSIAKPVTDGRGETWIEFNYLPDMRQNRLAAGRGCIMTVDEFGSWLEEHEALLWEIAKQPESPNVDRQVWAAVNDVMMKWNKVKRDG